MTKNPLAKLVDPAMYKHVSSDNDKTVLQHKHGHTLTIAHKNLSKDMQAQLKALSSVSKEDETPDQKQEAQNPYGKVIQKADGGDVEPPVVMAGQSSGTPPPKEKTSTERQGEVGKAAVSGEHPSAAKNLKDVWYNITHAQGGPVCMDEGGKVPVPPSDSSSSNQQQQNAKGAKQGFENSGGLPSASTLADRLKHAWAEGGEIPRKMYAEDGYVTGAPKSDDVVDVSKITGQPGYPSDNKIESRKPTKEEELKADLANRMDQLHELWSTLKGPGVPKNELQKQIEAEQASPPNAPESSPATVVDQTQAPVAAPTPGPYSEGYGAPKQDATASPDEQPQADAEAAKEVPATAAPAPAPATPPSSPQQAPAPRAPVTYEEHKNSILNELNTEAKNFHDDLMNGHITPKTYEDLMHDKSTMGKIGTLFGMLISGAGSGLAHQSNAVLDAMKQTIANDYNAQVQSKSNARSLYKLALEHETNKAANKLMGAQTANTNAEAGIKALTLARVHANQIALKNMIDMANKFPPGSQKWQEAQQALAMVAQGVQSENYDLNQRAAANLALTRMKMGVGQQGDPASQIRQKELLGYITPEQSRAALHEIGQMQNHVQLNNNALDSFDKVAKMATIAAKTASPIQNHRQIDAEWNPMMDKLTKDTEGRVTPITVDMMSALKPQVLDSPATLKMKRQKLNAILSGGMATPTLDSIGIPINKGEQPTPQNQSPQAALAWAKANPKDPRAVELLKLLNPQGR